MGTDLQIVSYSVHDACLPPEIKLQDHLGADQESVQLPLKQRSLHVIWGRVRADLESGVIRQRAHDTHTHR